MSQVIVSDETNFFLAGSVKWFDPVKGFGFIEPDLGGPDVLLHGNVLRNFGVNSVADGSLIEVTARKSTNGFQAFEVHTIMPPVEADGAIQMISIADLDQIELVPARIKWFNREKGYGFANAYGHTDDIFIGAGVLRRCGFAEVQDGEAVAVRVEHSARGQVASHVLSWHAAQEHAATTNQSCSICNPFDANERRA